MDEPVSVGGDKDYKAREEAFRKTLAEVAKKSGSKAAKALSVEEKNYADKDLQDRCRLVHRLVDESLEMYREGDMDFKEMVADLTKALGAIE